MKNSYCIEGRKKQLDRMQRTAFVRSKKQVLSEKKLKNQYSLVRNKKRWIVVTRSSCCIESYNLTVVQWCEILKNVILWKIKISSWWRRDKNSRPLERNKKDRCLGTFKNSSLLSAIKTTICWIETRKLWSVERNE